MAANKGSFTSVTGSRALGYAVGNTEWLTSEQSKIGKYFRSIEFGTEGFVGKKLWGLWGAGFREARVAGSPLYPAGFEGRRDQQFFPLKYLGMTPQAARRHVKGEHGLSNSKSPLVGTVGHEIAPMAAYETAAERFDPVEQERLAIEQAFKESGLLSASAASGRKQRGRSNVSGDVGKKFVGRLQGAGFIRASATSSRSRSIAQIDRTFQAELIKANRLLAEALAGEVALAVREAIEAGGRKASSTGHMEEATLNAKNRFPA